MADEHVDKKFCIHRSGQRGPDLSDHPPNWHFPIAESSSAAAVRYPQAFTQAFPDIVEEQHDDATDSPSQHGDDETGQTWPQQYEINGAARVLDAATDSFRIGNSFALGFVLGFVIAIWINRALSCC